MYTWEIYARCRTAGEALETAKIVMEDMPNYQARAVGRRVDIRKVRFG